jgi:hypothetical protein
MSFRPDVQESYRQTPLLFEREFKNQISHALKVEKTGTGWVYLAIKKCYKRQYLF